MNSKTLTITAKELSIVQQILKQYLPSNARVWVFGSRSLGKATLYSDLDLTIALSKQATLTLDTLAALQTAFEFSDLPYKVDLVDWNQISEEFKMAISQTRKALS